MKLWVYSGRPSHGAWLLAKQDGFGRLSANHLQPGDVIVNWGNVRYIPNSNGFLILNKQVAVDKAINKRTTFEILSAAGITAVPWTTVKQTAQGWLDNGLVVVARKTLTGYEGDGIVIVEPGEELTNAPLYTQFIHQVREFRVHTTRLGVIDAQWKVRGPGVLDERIKTYKNGYLFQRRGVQPDLKRDLLAVKAIQALGLDFGGLDIIEDKQGNFYVLEVNTAPGIDGTDLGRYATAIRSLAEDVDRVPIARPVGPRYRPVANALNLNSRPAIVVPPKAINLNSRPAIVVPPKAINLNKQWA